MKNKRYTLKNRTVKKESLTRENHGLKPKSLQNLAKIDALNTVSEFDSYPELTKAEILDFADATDSGPQS